MNTFEEFSKIINDFTNDLMAVFPELKPQLTNLDMNQYFHYCKDLYPETSFIFCMKMMNCLMMNKENFYYLK